MNHPKGWVLGQILESQDTLAVGETKGVDAYGGMRVHVPALSAWSWKE